MNQGDDFRNRLIAAQQFTPEYREKYERRLESMLTRQLTPGQRCLMAFIALLGLAAVVAIAWVLVVDKQTSIQFKYAVGFLGLVTLAITIIRGICVVTGTVDLRLQPRIITYLGYFGVVIFAVAAVMMVGLGPGAGGTDSIYILVVTLIPLVLVAGGLTVMQTRQSELTVREKLLEIELRLAEIGEKLRPS